MTATMRTIQLDDSDLKDTPPRTAPTTDTTGTTEPRKTTPSTAPPRSRDVSKLEGQIKDFYSQFGTYAAMMAPDPFVGSVVAHNADALASAWADLAAQDKRVKDALERILSGGSWAAVIGGHAVGIVLPILAYYGKLPTSAQQTVLGMTLAMASIPAEEGGNPVIAHCIQQRFGAPQE